MNRAEFLNALAEKLRGLSASEITKSLDFYSEMIDDRMEEGMTEPQAIEALGDIDSVASAIHASSGHTIRPEKLTGSYTQRTTEYKEAIREVLIKDTSANVKVSYSELPAGMTARLTTMESDTGCYACTLTDGKLLIEYKRSKSWYKYILNLIFQSRELTLTLGAPMLNSLRASTLSGSVDISNMATSGDMLAKSTSGSVRLSTLSIGGDLTAQSTSGSVMIDDLAVGGSLIAGSTSGRVSAQSLSVGRDTSLKSTSGSVRAGNAVLGGMLKISVTSGKASVTDTSAKRVAIKTMSSAITLEDLRVADALEASTTSGAIRLLDVSAGRMDLSAVSGSVTGTLKDDGHSYDVRATSTSGSVHVPEMRGERPVSIHTTSGKIRID